MVQERFRKNGRNPAPFLRKQMPEERTDMTMKTKRIAALLLALMTALSFAACEKKEEPAPPEEKVVAVEKIFDYVYDAGTFTEVDFDACCAFWSANYDNWETGCTCVAKTLEDGTVMLGRNMDLTISNRAAYVFRTKIEGCYETLNLAYTYRDYAPYAADIDANGGVPEDFYTILPSISDDVLNEKGLYIEVNMRNAECWPNGTSKFACSGTNPDSDTRIYMFQLPMYVATHCATVAEAVEYVKTLDVYSKDGYWNYCYMIADPSGHYGLLEFAQNEVIWLDGQKAQANFYVSEENYAINEYKSGIGRYNYVLEHIDQVETQEEMFDLMNTIRYSQVYSDSPKFDRRSEFVAEYPYWTYDYVTDEANAEEINTYAQMASAYFTGMTRQELQDMCLFWESAFTEVINCNERTIFVRFFEDNAKTMTLSF